VALDGERFTRWMNNPRVNAFWEMAGPQAEQENYLRRQLDSTYCYPVIGCFDDQPFGYLNSTGHRKTALAATTAGSRLTAGCTCWWGKRTGAARSTSAAGCAV
jgi:hypothetical protein